MEMNILEKQTCTLQVVSSDVLVLCRQIFTLRVLFIVLIVDHAVPAFFFIYHPS